MSREIKFRAFDMIGKNMREVSEISFDNDGSIHGLLKEEPTDNFGRVYFSDEQLLIGGNEPYHEHIVLMRYTGFKLKGKEIYEGDIIRAEYEGEEIIGDVYYENLRFDLNCDYDPECNVLLFLEANDIGKVIGNVYENPDLLTN